MRADIKVLILGANGFIGRNILASLYNSNFTLVASSGKEDIAPNERHRYVRLGLTNVEIVKNFLSLEMPDVIVNCAAISTPDYCDLHREEAYAVNVEAVKLLAQYSSKNKKRVIHLSTDFVFDGIASTPIVEDTATTPINYYGETKAESEVIVASMAHSWAVARVAIVYGNTLLGQHGNIVRLVKSRLEKGEPISVVNDQLRTPTFVNDIAKGVKSLIEKEINGYFHLCGKEVMSISQVAHRVADYWKLDKSLISSISTAEMNEKIRRPLYSALSIEKTRTILGYEPLSFEESLQFIH